MGDKPDDGKIVNSSGNIATNGEAELNQKDKEFIDVLNKGNSVKSNYNNKDDGSSTDSSNNDNSSENQNDNNHSVSSEQSTVNTDNEETKNNTYSPEQIPDDKDVSVAQQQTGQQQTGQQQTGQQQAGQEQSESQQTGQQQVETPKAQQPSQSQNNQSGQNIDTEKLTCTFSISCATILNNMDKLDKDKKGLVPEDGWILAPITVEIKQGETVFDVLKRICMSRKLHMESSWTPIYNSAYIEGINNLYQFDCGSLSGWMYCVNGTYYNYGCSKAVIENGDIVEWVYTCDLGKDVQK